MDKTKVDRTRGKGTCSNCGQAYACRYKPERCCKCNFYLGGSFQPKNIKRQRKNNPEVVRVTQEIFSVKTSTKDDRCFVIKEGANTICLHRDCKQLRATYSASGQLERFACKHSHAIEQFPSSKPINTYDLSENAISTYSGDRSSKESLTALLDCIPESHPSVARVSDSTFVVFGRPTSNNTIGYCHVHVISEESRAYNCTSKRCRTFVSNSKQSKVRSTCEHLHLLYCLLHQNNELAPQNPPQADPVPASSTPLSRQATLDLAMSFTLPYEIPSSAIKAILQRDAASLLNVPDGWPDTYQPSANTCSLCQSPLAPPRQHPGQSSNDSAYLLTELNPFKRIHIFVKMCSNPSCNAMHQTNTFEIGECLSRIKDLNNRIRTS